MNKIILIGNLTKDPELTKVGAEGISRARFSVAVTRPFSRREKTDFINVVCWRSTAENVHQYLMKGSKVAVDGYLTIESYEDSNGVKRIATEVVASNIEFLSSKGSVSNTKNTSSNKLEEVDSDEECPF